MVKPRLSFSEISWKNLGKKKKNTARQGLSEPRSVLIPGAGRGRLRKKNASIREGVSKTSSLVLSQKRATTL